MLTNSNQSVYKAISWVPITFMFGLICNQTNATNTLNVFACEPEYASLTQILTPKANIYSATTAHQDPHLVQARPSLIAKMRGADLAVCAGADLEVGWLPMLQMKSANPKVQNGQQGLFFAAENVPTLDKIDKVDRSMGDVHAKGNPHVHFDPTLALSIARKLTDRLIAVDPLNKVSYQQNFNHFESRWLAFIKELKKSASRLKGQKVIAYHSNFRYLFNWLGIDQIADLEPKPGLPPTSRHLTDLLEIAKNNEVKVIVISNYQSERGAKWLSEKTNIPILVLPSTVGGNENSADLFALYQSAVDLLLEQIDVTHHES